SGKWRIVQLTSIPSFADIDLTLSKSEEAQRIEALRLESVGRQGDGIIIINEAKLVNGQYEIGPLCRNQNDQVLGAGIRSGRGAIEEFLEEMNTLRVIDRARFALNHFASTVLEVRPAGRELEKVF